MFEHDLHTPFLFNLSSDGGMARGDENIKIVYGADFTASWVQTDQPRDAETREQLSTLGLGWARAPSWLATGPSMRVTTASFDAIPNTTCRNDWGQRFSKLPHAG